MYAKHKLQDVFVAGIEDEMSRLGWGGAKASCQAGRHCAKLHELIS